MKKILLSAHCKTHEQQDVAKTLLEILLSKGHCVDLATNFELDIQKDNMQLISTDKLLSKEYDVILAYNLKGYHNIRHLAKTKNIPVIYIVQQKDCVEEYLYDVSLVCNFLIINDGDDLSYLPFPENCSTLIPYLYLPPRQNIVAINSTDGVLVATDDKTLLKIIPVLNNLRRHNFTIVTDIPSIIKKVVNKNCTVLSARKTNLVEAIRNAALVVGCGKTILTSLSYGKPSIVVGKYGFGRRIIPKNVELHLHFLFRGRLGARSEEFIPNSLLSHEIKSCMNSKPEDSEAIDKSLVDILTAKYEQTVSLIDDLICSVCISKSVLDTPLRLSSLYKFLVFNESSRLVIDCRMLKIHATINQDEYDLIQSFEEGATAKAVMQKNMYGKTPKQFVSFVKYLIDYKFLVLDYDKEADF